MWILWSYCLWLREWGHWELEADFPYESSKVSNSCDSTTDLWNCTSIKENKETIIVWLLKVFWLNNDTEKERDLKFIDYAKAILNITLWLIAFIALIMSIYTFYMMMFSENEAWIKKAKWNLVWIFIALAVIWLAWVIVSFIFWWYEKNWAAAAG